MSTNISPPLHLEAQALLAWVQTKLAFTNTEGLSVFERRALERCERVCSDLLAGKVGIPARFCRSDYVTWQKFEHLVNEARRDRNAILQMMVAGTLSDLSEQVPSPEKQRHLFKTLIREFGRDRNPVPPGLMPDRQHGNQNGQGGYAGSSQAKAFFENRLRKTLGKIDDVYESALSTLPPPDYDPTDVTSVAAWGLAWTQATAAVATDWLSEKGALTRQGVLHAMQAGGISQFRPNNTAGGGTLPTSDKTLRGELWARPLLCQVLRHNPQLEATMDDSSYGVVYFWLKDLTVESSYWTTYPTGRSTAHLYLTVWLERVTSLLSSLTNASPMNTASNFPLPAALSRDIAPGQHATVSALIERFQDPCPQNGGSGVWFSGPPTSMGTSLNVDGLPTGPGETEVSPAKPSGSRVLPLPQRLVNAQPAPADRPECLGSIALSWKLLSKVDCPAEWMDLAFIVHHQQAWHAMVVDIEEDETDDNRIWLSVDPALAEPWGIEAVRQALASATWVFRRAGLGVFVAGAVDLDAQGQ